MKGLLSKKPALLLTPKSLWILQGDEFVRLDSLKDLLRFKFSELDVFIDGFSQDFTNGTIPLVGFLDRRSAVSHKLSRVFKDTVFYGGCYHKENDQLCYEGFGFKNSKGLGSMLQELQQLKISIISLKSLVFSCASSFLSHFLSHINGQAVLWISPYLEDGLRVILYTHQGVKLVRTITHSLKDPTAEKDLLQTLSYIQNEYNIDLKDLNILTTSLTAEEFPALKQVEKSATLYKWDYTHLQRIMPSNFNEQINYIEAWIIPYGQKVKTFLQDISQSPLSPEIKKNVFFKFTAYFLQAACLTISVFVMAGVFKTIFVYKHLGKQAQQMQLKETQIQELSAQLQLPQDLDIRGLYAFIDRQQQKSPQHDPLVLLSHLTEVLESDLLIQEFLWQTQPKPTLKISFNLARVPEEKRGEVLIRFKDKLVQTLKQKDDGDIAVVQPTPQTLDIVWP